MTYRVVVTREGRNWLAEVPEVPGVHTFAGNLAKLERYVREAIAAMLDLPRGEDVEDGLALSWVYDLGLLSETAAQVRADRARLDDEERRLGVRMKAAAEMLQRLGASSRDAARILGVSPQRISQVAPRH